MSWIFLAILSYIIWSPTNIVDKILVTKYYKSYFSLTFVATIMSSILILSYIGIVYGFKLISGYLILFLIIAGILRIISHLFYYKATSYEEASKISILWQSTPVFVLILSAIFLNEQITATGYLAFVLLLVAGLLATFQYNLSARKIKIGPAFWDMLVCVITLAFSTVLAKHFLISDGFWQILPYMIIGELIGVLILSFIYKVNCYQDFLSSKKTGQIMLFSSEILNSIAFIVYMMALSIGSASIISALSVVNPIFVFLLAAILSYWWPKVIREEIDNKSIILKISAIILVGVGIYLLNI